MLNKKGKKTQDSERIINSVLVLISKDKVTLNSGQLND